MYLAKSIDVPVNKFGTVALTFIAWLACVILFIVELIIGLINSLFIYPTFIFVLSLTYKLAEMVRKQIKELIVYQKPNIEVKEGD